MKKIKALSAFFISACLICGIMTVTASASDITAKINIPTSSIVTENKITPVSYGLNVLAEQKPVSIAGIKGNALYFSSDKIACAMNLESVDSITITKLPDVTCGALYIGSNGVSLGQKIKASELKLMTYEEVDGRKGSGASFEFRVNDSEYSMTCKIYMLDDINYSPTLTHASFASLNAKTYKGIDLHGVLSAYDPEGDELRYEIVRYPENGRVNIENEALGIYVYSPYENFTGEDSFEYVVCDKYGNYSSSAKVSISVTAQSTSMVYSDLLNDELYSHAIAVTESGLMNGIQIGDYYYFEADRPVSRAEFIVTAMKACGIKNVPDADTTVFHDDIEINPEMKGYIALAHSLGYISGIQSEGKLYFKSSESIKFSEAAVIISNMIGYASPKVTPVFADADSIPSWSGKAIESLHTLGILETPEMVSGASNTVTRGDMARLLDKTMFVIGK